MKNILSIISICTVLLTASQTSFAQDPNHPAYNYATTFSNSPRFIEGFLYAFDAGKQIFFTGNGVIYKRKLNVAGYVIELSVVGLAMSLGDISTNCYQSYIGVSGYAATLSDPYEREFWEGYASLMFQGANNPLIFNITNGQIY